MNNKRLYRAHWDIDVLAANAIQAARFAEVIMKTRPDGSPHQARVIDVTCADTGDRHRVDLAAPHVTAVPLDDQLWQKSFIIEDASDPSYLYVEVRGKGRVYIKRDEEGIVADIYPLHQSNHPSASAWAHDNDLAAPADEGSVS